MAEAEAQTAPASESSPTAPEPSGVPDNWRDSLPPEIGTHASLARIKPGKDGFVDLARGYVSAQDFIGAEKAGRGLVRPKDDATPEEWGKFYETLGRPDAADKYEYAPPEGATVDDNFLTGFRKTAHEAGLSAKQFKALSDWYNGETVNHFKGLDDSRKAQATETETALRVEWKDGYDQHRAMAKNAASKLGIDDAELAALEGAVGGAKLMKALAVVGKGYAEDSPTGGGPTDFRMTATEAKSQIAALQRDETFMKQFLERGPGHDEAVAQMQRLRRIAG